MTKVYKCLNLLLFYPLYHIQTSLKDFGGSRSVLLSFVFSHLQASFFFLFTNIWFLFSYLQSLIHDSNLTISSMRADSLKTSTKRSAFVFEAQVAISTTFIKSRFTLRSRNDVCIFGKKGVSREMRFAKQQFCELHVTPCLRSVN